MDEHKGLDMELWRRIGEIGDAHAAKEWEATIRGIVQAAAQITELTAEHAAALMVALRHWGLLDEHPAFVALRRYAELAEEAQRERG